MQWQLIPSQLRLRVFTVCFSALLLSVSTAVTVGAEASEIPDPGDWYSQSYGPLWHEAPWDKLEEILFHYDSEYWGHPAEGEPQLRKPKESLSEAMVEWRAEGWISSEVPDIRVNRLNDSTVTFTTRWLDHYSNREDDYSCAWYLADLIDGNWKFTQFAPIDCEAHGF